MPRKPNKPCSYTGCPELCEGRYCDKHQREMDIEYDRSNRPYKKLYKTGKWQKLRRQVLANHPLCKVCKINGRIIKATVVDHINPHKGDEKLFYDIENLQSLCKSCHDSKTAKEDGRWKLRVYTY
ncbi:HNH endonuclease signature motif containing protein [Alkaliphilus peptidifermentans]|uniref:Putative HNH nuclease YajD n=1 Tax=Alkaliphilus peptidifermentans DSM 18978 TaxID=1120976 RepID=A0A1G5EG17_9FIRM|nr:HNH endonuclease signature motif containing protein [Alkaliphilus peptidifermentans]SCY25922.1 5-methylcytosine-specific restriction enzyme A [Alkaliphilus peptidifermentans DSM 18978]